MFHGLSLEEKRLIVQLPYRVGLYVSESDAGGGEDADAQEALVLANIIRGFAEEVMGAESIQHVISTTLMLREQWPEWDQDLKDVPEECREACEIVREHVSVKDGRAYAYQMYEIAEAVALAFKEYEEGNVFRDIGQKIAYFFYKRQAKRWAFREKSYEEFISISSAERVALKNIAQGLQLSS